MNDKLLSIGSVVLLKEANKRVMVIGYYPTYLEDNKEVTYDYSGCLFPEGVMDSKNSMLFNHSDVDKIFYYGLMDEEQNDFMTRLMEFVKEENNNKANEGDVQMENSSSENNRLGDLSVISKSDEDLTQNTESSINNEASPVEHTQNSVVDPFANLNVIPQTPNTSE